MWLAANCYGSVREGNGGTMEATAGLWFWESREREIVDLWRPVCRGGWSVGAERGKGRWRGPSGVERGKLVLKKMKASVS